MQHMLCTACSMHTFKSPACAAWHACCDTPQCRLAPSWRVCSCPCCICTCPVPVCVCIPHLVRSVCLRLCRHRLGLFSHTHSRLRGEKGVCRVKGVERERKLATNPSYILPQDSRDRSLWAGGGGVCKGATAADDKRHTPATFCLAIVGKPYHQYHAKCQMTAWQSQGHSTCTTACNRSPWCLQGPDDLRVIPTSTAACLPSHSLCQAPSHILSGTPTHTIKLSFHSQTLSAHTLTCSCSRAIALCLSATLCACRL